MKIVHLILALGLFVLIGCSKSNDSQDQIRDAEFEAFKTEIENSA